MQNVGEICIVKRFVVCGTINKMLTRDRRRQVMLPKWVLCHKKGRQNLVVISVKSDFK